jgi:hypothetical protein
MLWRHIWREEVQGLSFLTLKLEGVSGQFHAPAPLPLGRNSSTHQTDSLGVFGKEKNLLSLLGFKNQIVQSFDQSL